MSALSSWVAPCPSLLLVPTGIGCEVGGFAGDALPSARLLAAASGCLITHPNVMNGASLCWSDPRIHYVEAMPLIVLRSVIGCCGRCVANALACCWMPALSLSCVNVISRSRTGCRASLGLEIGPVVTTDAPLGVHLELGTVESAGGLWSGRMRLLRAGERLKAAGATAIAVVARFPEDPDGTPSRLIAMVMGWMPLLGRRR